MLGIGIMTNTFTLHTFNLNMISFKDHSATDAETKYLLYKLLSIIGITHDIGTALLRINENTRAYRDANFSGVFQVFYTLEWQVFTSGMIILYIRGIRKRALIMIS